MSETFITGTKRLELRWFIVASIVLASVLLAAFADRSNPFVVFPRDWNIDFATPLGDGLKYLAREFEIASVKLSTVTRAMGWLVSQPFEFLKGLLAEGFTFYSEDAPPFHIPPLPWMGVAAVFVIVAWHFGSSWLTLWTALTFIGFALSGLWESAMLTMASVVIAVIIGVLGGVVLGIWGFRSATANAVLQPIYDVMQTLPLFSYLVPMILFFGFGPIAALMATVIFALPPMARVTTQAMRAVPKSVGEFGSIAGCNRLQMTWLVMVPAARQHLLLGVNQVIMLSLAVVIVASLIGAGGLGGDVLKALKSVRIGDALAAGFSITFLAILLDQLSYAIAMRRPVHETRRRKWFEQHWLLLVCVACLVLSVGASNFVSSIHTWPEELTFKAGRYGNGIVDWIGSTFKNELDGLRDWTIIYILKPTKIFFLKMPWAGFVLVVGALGWVLGGWRLAALGVGVFLAIAVLGYWKKAMLSLYLVSLSVVFAMIIGGMLGLWAGISDRANKCLIVAVDVLQTLPTFVYLIPVVMLFSIGDFPAFVAIVVYAIAPAIRYTANGIRNVRPTLIEGALMSGCDRQQIVSLIKVPLALPTILLGLNQVVMMAFGMLVITALVGTRGLEEVTLVAIARVEPGDGLLAGLAIAGMAIVFDRYIKAANKKLAYQLGLPIPE